MFLATGCGKSGTMWTMELFRALGWDCSHEHQFTLDRHGPLKRNEVSWLAAPYLDRLPHRTPVLFVVRDPYLVVASAWRMGLFANPKLGPYERFILEHFPSAESNDRLTSIIRWVTLWDRHVPSYTNLLLRVGHDGPEQVAYTLGQLTGQQLEAVTLKKVMGRVGKVHTSPRWRQAPDQDMINAHPEGWRIRQRAQAIDTLTREVPAS